MRHPGGLLTACTISITYPALLEHNKEGICQGTGEVQWNFDLALPFHHLLRWHLHRRHAQQTGHMQTDDLGVKIIRLAMPVTVNLYSSKSGVLVPSGVAAGRVKVLFSSAEAGGSCGQND
jgi:hypothetical protein